MCGVTLNFVNKTPQQVTAACILTQNMFKLLCEIEFKWLINCHMNNIYFSFL